MKLALRRCLPALMALVVCAGEAFALCGPHDTRRVVELLPRVLPEGCLARYRDAVSSFTAAGKNLAGHHPSFNEIIKRDVVCFGEHIHVKEPIYTNGGDVLIFAGSVTLHAPIDTRIYQSTDSLKKPATAEMSGVPSTSPVYVVPADGTCRVARGWPNEVRLGYGRYYSSCVDCVKVDRDCKPNDATCRNLDKLSLIPRMPDGLIPVSWANLDRLPAELLPRPISAPDYSMLARATLRSGDIRVFTRQIQGPEAKAPSSIANSKCEHVFAQEKHKNALLNASGLLGGRGGPGRLLHYRLREPSVVGGAGGPGGDAGNINLHLFSSPSSSESASYPDSIGIEGGAPGANKGYLAPEGFGPFVPVSHDGTICPFFRPDRATVSYPQPEAGNKGRFSVNVSRSDLYPLFDQFWLAASSLDASHRYSPLSLSAAGVPREPTDWLSFQDFLTVRVAAVVSDMQAALMDTIVDQLSERAPANKIFMGGYFTGNSEHSLTIQSRHVDGRTKFLLKEANALQRSLRQESDRPVPEMRPAHSYFLHHDGLFNVRGAKTGLQNILDSIRDVSAQTQRTDQEVLSLLTEMKERSFGEKLKAQREIGEARREEVRKQIAQVEELLNQHTSKSREFAAGVKQMKTFIDVVKDVYAVFTTGNLALIPEIAKGLDELSESGRRETDGFYGLLNQVPALRAAYLQIQQEIFDLGIAVAANELVQRKVQRDAIYAYSKGQSFNFLRRVDRVFNFPDMLKWTLVGYLLDPSRSVVELDNRFRQLKRFIHPEDWVAAGLTFGPVDESRCVTGSPDWTRCFKVTVDFRDGKRHVKLDFLNGETKAMDADMQGADVVVIVRVSLNEKTIAVFPAYASLSQSEALPLSTFQLRDFELVQVSPSP